MKFFVFDQEGMSTALAWRLQLEGHDVMFFSQNDEGKTHLLNMVPIAKTLQDGLRFIGRDGYFICGDEQDCSGLRKAGFKGYGGNKFTNRLENDRVYEMTMAKQLGVRIPNFHEMNSFDDAIKFIKKNPDQYVLKQLGHLPKSANYVGKEEDGSDIIHQLEWMKKNPDFKRAGSAKFMLQEFVEGIEFACAAYWQYDRWMENEDRSLILELNSENKKALTGGLGITTGEMGTVAMLAEENRLFDEMVDKWTPWLKKYCSDVSINFDCNCGIVEDDDGEIHAYLYECTPRTGYPSTSLVQYMITSGIADFYQQLIERRNDGIEWRYGYGVVTVIGCGNFPTEGENHEGSYKDQPVRLPFEIDMWNEHFQPGYINYDPQNNFFRIADYYEMVGTCTYHSDDPCEANRNCVELMKEIDVRSPNFRLDIGEHFKKCDMDKLCEWGYLPEQEDYAEDDAVRYQEHPSQVSTL